MSIQNLVNTDIDALDIPCTVSGAISGTAIINLKRLDNIVYLSTNIFTAAVGVAGPTITYTPIIAVPMQYQPAAGVVRYRLSLVSNSVGSEGNVIFPNSLATLSFTLSAGGNFLGLGGVLDNTVMWKVVSQ